MSDRPTHKRPLKKSLLLWTRTLHIYGSMAALLTILFFAATGFLLNHPDWFELEAAVSKDRDAVLPEDVAASEDQLKVVEYLRASEGATGSVKSYTRRDDQTVVTFAGPARSVSYEIGHDTGDTLVHEETRNALAFLGDLHRGHYTGRAWPLVIDVTAWGLILASVSGLVLWVSLAKRRTLGIVAFVASVLVFLGVVGFLIP